MNTVTTTANMSRMKTMAERFATKYRIDARKGRDNRLGGAKLTPDDVRMIRRLRETGYRVTDIGRAYGVSHCIISDITLRKSWKDVQ